jgi:hypothetical protein
MVRSRKILPVSNDGKIIEIIIRKMVPKIPSSPKITLKHNAEHI